MTQPLSPAAQAVLDHFLVDVEISLEHGLASALRAAADQCTNGAAHWELYAIAAELEGRHG